MNYTQSVEYIHSLLTFGIKPGLERIKELMALLGNPQDKIKTVHVAGTNGKGSTSTMIAEMLIVDGYKTGLFTSPYVIDFCERIQLNGEMVDKKLFADCATIVREKIEELNARGMIITEFEAITAAAFLCFYKCGCDFAVIEVGLGGRFDATNVIKNPSVVVITSISLDHTAILGDTVSQIAFEKCGIIKDGVTVITSVNQSAEAMAVIEKTVSERGGRLIKTDPSTAEIISDTLDGKEFAYGGLHFKSFLFGEHQTENTVNAVEAARYLGLRDSAVTNGVMNTRMTARMEIISHNPLVIRDGGHNAGCGTALRDYIKRYGIKKIKLIIGMMSDKDVESYVSAVVPLCSSAVTVTPSNPRAMNGSELLKIVQKYCTSCKFIDNPRKGYEYVLTSAEKDDTVLICGSFYLMSDIF